MYVVSKHCKSLDVCLYRATDSELRATMPQAGGRGEGQVSKRERERKERKTERERDRDRDRERDRRARRHVQAAGGNKRMRLPRHTCTRRAWLIELQKGRPFSLGSARTTL